MTADAGVALSLVRLLTVRVGQQEVMREVEGAIPVFEELGDRAALARALGVAGALRYWRGEVEAAAEDLERAARYARDVGDRAQEALSLQYVLLAILFGPTPVDRALERVEEIRSRTKTNRRLEVDLLRTRGHLEAMRGRFDAARDLIAQATALGQELGLEGVLVGGLPIQAGDVELLAGDAIAAERALRPACETLERTGDLGHLASVGPLLTDALFVQGRDDEALRLSDRWTPERITVPDDADAQISWRRVRAKLLARRGEVEEAERLAREAISIAARTDLLDPYAHSYADLATVLRLAGRPEESAAAAREAIRLYEEKGNIAAAAAVAATMSVSAPP